MENHSWSDCSWMLKMLEITTRVCYTLWNHEYCIIKCFLGHKFLCSTKMHTHPWFLSAMCKHSTQFNPSSFSRPSPTCEHIHTDAQGMELAWMDTMYERNYDCIQPHNDVLVSTTEGIRTRVFRTTQCSSCEDNFEIWQQWQWKQQCPQQHKQNGVFTMKAKLWTAITSSMNSNNMLWRWNLMKHWLLWLDKFI
jgi:hypothetical protein